MNLRYTLGSLISIPLLPALYFQGKKVMSTIPKLPEATGTTGIAQYTKETNRTLRLLTIGESTIAGVGVKTHEEGFSGSLAKELSCLLECNMNWTVYARSGFTAKDVLTKLLPTIKEKEFDLIVIGLGGNDAFGLHRPSYWKKYIQKVIDTLRTQYPTTPIVFCNMPPIKEFPAFTPVMKFILGNLVEIFGKELDKLIQNYPNVYYHHTIIRMQEWAQRFDIKAEASSFFSDGVHPSLLTYQTWAKDLALKIHQESIQHNLFLIEHHADVS